MSGIDEAKTRILRAVSLEAVIAEKISLQSRSGRKVGLCPFHNEKSPSFTVYDDHYFCFGCKAHGDAIDFLRNTQGVGFIEALRFLAQKFGVAAPELDSNDKFTAQRQRLGRLYNILQSSQRFFLKNIQGDAGKSAREYLMGRGFALEEQEKFGFGLCFDRPYDLVNALKAEGFSEEESEGSGIASFTQDRRRVVDFFRSRIMIPIKDPQGRIIAFGGRTTNNHPAKYLNGRETVLFSKSETLFGMDTARPAIRQQNRAIVVEGYMDALSLQKYGFSETVAVLGTALTISHLRSIDAICNRMYLLFDGDSAGENASLKALDLCLKFPRLSVMMVRLPSGLDPDTYVIKNGREGLENLLAGAEPLVDFAIKENLNRNRGMEVIASLRSQIIPWLSQLSDPLQRSYLTSRVAQKSGIAVRELELLIENPVPQKISTQVVEEKIDPKPVAPDRDWNQLLIWERDLIAHLILAKGTDISDIGVGDILKEAFYRDGIWKELVEKIFAKLSDAERGKTSALEDSAFLASFTDLRLTKTFETIESQLSAYQSSERGSLIKRLVLFAKTERLKKTLVGLKAHLSTALTRGEDGAEESKQLLQSIQSMNRELAMLRNPQPNL